jgi:hypothetical protein
VATVRRRIFSISALIERSFSMKVSVEGR